MSEHPPFPSSQTSHLAWRRVALWSGAAVIAAGVLIPLQAVSRDQPSAPAYHPESEQLNLQSQPQATEGKAFDVRLGWRHLPHNVSVQSVDLELRWQDTSYDGKALEGRLPLSLGRLHEHLQLVFQSPGKHKLELMQGSQLWKSFEVDVRPYPATVFPAHWEENRSLPEDPARSKIWVNLQYDPKQPLKQRQYMQVTVDNQIVERLLVSSGALANMTPTGEFSLGFKDYYPRSAKYNNTPMPFWSAINVPGHPGEFGFHSLEDGGYYYLLGRPASHGCIRMSRLPSVEKDPKTGQLSWGDRGGARWVYDRVPKGVAVSMFRHKLPSFVFEDYEHYLSRQAREAAAARKLSPKAKTT